MRARLKTLLERLSPSLYSRVTSRPHLSPSEWQALVWFDLKSRTSSKRLLMRAKYMCEELAKIDSIVQITRNKSSQVSLKHLFVCQLSQVAHQIWPTATEKINVENLKLNNRAVVSWKFTSLSLQQRAPPRKPWAPIPIIISNRCHLCLSPSINWPFPWSMDS